MASSRKTTSGGVRKATSRVPSKRGAVHETGKAAKSPRSGKGSAGRTHTTGGGLSSSSKPKATPRVATKGKATSASVKGKAGNVAYPAGSNRGGTNSLMASGASGPKVVSMSGAVNNTGRGYQRSGAALKRATPKVGKKGGSVHTTGTGLTSSGPAVKRHANAKATLPSSGSVRTGKSSYQTKRAPLARHRKTTSS
jgi:hypothetical protein